VGQEQFSRLTQTLLLAATFIIVVWGALAFGAVYEWAFVPLAWACAITGIAALTLVQKASPSAFRLGLGFALIALVAAFQLMPLSAGVLRWLSPGTDRFLAMYRVGYHLYLPADAADDFLTTAFVVPRPISIDPEKTLRGLLLFVSFAVFLIGLVRLFTAVGVLPVVRGVALFGAALAIFAIAQYALSGGATYLLRIYGFWKPMYRAAPFGPFINRNHFAGWMLMVVPLAAAGAYASASGERLRSARDFVAWLSASPAAAQMLLMATAAGIMGLSVLISNSRSGISALAIETALFAWMIVSRQGSRRTRMLTIAGFAIVAVAVVVWAGVDQFLSRAATLSHDLPTGGGRFGAWRDALRIVHDFPLAGTGLNTYGTAMVIYQSSNRALSFQEAHNDYLQLAAEGGALLSVAIILSAWAFVSGVRARFHEAPMEGTTYWIRVGAVIALIGIAIQSAVEFSLQMPGNAALFAVVAALALHRSPHLRARTSRPHS